MTVEFSIDETRMDALYPFFSRQLRQSHKL